LDRDSIYRIIEHTADIGIEVEAADQAGIFVKSALALADLMFGLDTIGRRDERLVRAQGDSLEELLVAWLNEILYVSAVDKMLFSEFSDARLAGNSFSARGWGEKLDPGLHAAEMEIKAATYHGLAFRSTGGGWTARIILDV
jgi:SHS2 domain-containing protein